MLINEICEFVKIAHENSKQCIDCYPPPVHIGIYNMRRLTQSSRDFLVDLDSVRSAALFFLGTLSIIGNFSFYKREASDNKIIISRMRLIT